MPETIIEKTDVENSDQMNEFNAAWNSIKATAQTFKMAKWTTVGKWVRIERVQDGHFTIQHPSLGTAFDVSVLELTEFRS